MSNDITVCIAAHPARARNGMLDRALASVSKQTLLPHRVIVQMDHDLEGGHVTHHKMLDGVNTEWVAFLDSDDEFYPEHLEKLLAFALETEADYVYSWYDIHPPINGDVLPHFGKVFDNANPTLTTITIMVKTELAQRVGFQGPQEGETLEYVMGEDFRFTLRCVDEGAKIMHLAEKTWAWHHHGANTSSNPKRGDAARDR